VSLICSAQKGRISFGLSFTYITEVTAALPPPDTYLTTLTALGREQLA
jgi:hypothetical protein